ncbi:DUF4128 domain-containing protein [Delftia tsuruhatensis]|uniref:DUF4128 domain-containing protein n=1 Tax=Delftia tsuruhatensis TaxID=180282 RepID=UPI0024483DC3|nr:DUF4128 domain-containing protein [Delftia tsuruhatensis]MDH1824612.1 DUF4128 domain-containing protein [Delftia tsuruhatensis]
MSIVAIETALEERLQTLPTPPPIAWEDVAFEPTTGQGYLRVRHLHNHPRDLFIEGGPAELPGIFQVDVVWPAGRGKVEAKQMAEQVAALFAPVQSLDAGNRRIELAQTPAIAGGMPDEGWYTVPVSINWRAFPV